MPKTVYLVSCVGTKQTHTSPARYLYTSPWFVKARRYVEARSGEWFILSAEHGLIDPDQVIAPYERTLNKMKKADRVAWGQGVCDALERIVDRGLFQGFPGPFLKEVGYEFDLHGGDTGLLEQGSLLLVDRVGDSYLDDQWSHVSVGQNIWPDRT